MTIAQPSLGYIGLGNMGGPMTVRLAQAGFNVHVYGRNKERLKPALSVGAIERPSPSAVAERSDILFICATDTAAVEDIVFGTNGVVAGARRGSLLIDMSTISPDATIDMAAKLDKASGMTWMDAPVSGGTVGAETGTLAIFVGGRIADFERARPTLQHLGRNITLMGPLGAGQTTKLINQIIVACSVAMLAEAVGLAQRAGLDAAAIPDALAGGRADSAALRHYWPRLAGKDFTPLGNLKSIVKDIDLVKALGRRLDALLPMTGMVREYNQLLINRGHAGEDLTALARLFSP